MIVFLLLFAQLISAVNERVDLESENQHLKAEIEALHRKSENLSESLASLKIENERLSSEEKR